LEGRGGEERLAGVLINYNHIEVRGEGGRKGGGKKCGKGRRPNTI